MLKHLFLFFILCSCTDNSQNLIVHSKVRVSGVDVCLLSEGLGPTEIYYDEKHNICILEFDGHAGTPRKLIQVDCEKVRDCL